MKTLTDFFFRVTSGYLFLLFFAVQVIFSSVILPHYQKQFDPEMTIGVPDLTFGFSAETLSSMLDQYGEQGRQVYLFVASVIDIIYPLVYTLALCFLIAFLFKRNGWVKWRNLVLAPFLIAFFDFMENLGIIRAAATFPQLSEGWARFGSIAGMIKWVAFGLCLVIALTGLISWLIKSVSKKKGVAA